MNRKIGVEDRMNILMNWRNKVIEFGNENMECGKFPPYVISCREIIDEQTVLNTLEIVVGVESGAEYRIVFKDYMMHLTRNESYTAWDNYEVRKGRYFVVFEKSRMLDFLDTVIIHTDDHSWPGIGRHYGVYTCDHIIDVITAHEPEITQIS